MNQSRCKVNESCPRGLARFERGINRGKGVNYTSFDLAFALVLTDWLKILSQSQSE